MPCALANGLLPGRGPAGRWPMPWLLANGLLPGRGVPPGRGAPPAGAASPVASAGAAGAAGAAGDGAAGAGAAGAAAAGAAGAGAGAGAAASAGAAGPGVGAPGRGAPGRAAPGRAPPGDGLVAAAAEPVDDAGAADAAGAAVFPAPSASRAARSLRATGGSMVDEGLLTNSPSSLSLARAILLSTPSSDAISCTRGLAATILLSGLVYPGRADLSRGRVSFRAVHFVSIAVQPFLEGLRIQRTCHTQCPHKSTAPYCGIHAFTRLVHPRAPARHRRPLICDEGGIDGHNSQECGPGGTHAASDARSYRLHVTPSGWFASCEGPAQFSSTLSGWMSILAPVSFAARRAFWPSLPMASDS